MKPTPFGVRLRQARKAAGISPSVLSVSIGGSRDVVRQIEVGLIQKPNVELASRLAAALGVTLDWLASGIGTAPVKRSPPPPLARTGT